MSAMDSTTPVSGHEPIPVNRFALFSETLLAGLLVLVLSIPLVTDAGAALPGRDQVLLLTTAVIVITLVIQGASLGPMVRRAGVAVGVDDVRDETRLAQTVMASAALSYLDSCEASDDITAGEPLHHHHSVDGPLPGRGGRARRNGICVALTCAGAGERSRWGQSPAQVTARNRCGSARAADHQ